jgi:hypothetical protein
MEKINFPDPGIIFLSRGKTEAGKPYWAYVMIPLDNLEGYCKAQGKGAFSLQDHGYVIYWDEGEEPPEEIKKEMAELYGTQDDFVEQFMEKLQKTPGGKQFIEMVRKEAEKLRAFSD